MPTNIEIKARLWNLHRQNAVANAMATSPVQVYQQHDTCFVVPNGRLKLRVQGENGDHGELIFYRRDDTPRPKSSAYCISISDDPTSLRSLLAEALGIRGEVRKHRIVYVVGQTRIHFDQVEGLGSFVELEVVLSQDQTEAEGQEIAERIMKRLEIRHEDLVSGAYLDLLLRSRSNAECTRSKVVQDGR